MYEASCSIDNHKEYKRADPIRSRQLVLPAFHAVELETAANASVSSSNLLSLVSMICRDLTIYFLWTFFSFTLGMNQIMCKDFENQITKR